MSWFRVLTQINQSGRDLAGNLQILCSGKNPEINTEQSSGIVL
jgi:hypothetical protein